MRRASEGSLVRDMCPSSSKTLSHLKAVVVGTAEAIQALEIEIPCPSAE
jgi:hypothetical protein